MKENRTERQPLRNARERKTGRETRGTKRRTEIRTSDSFLVLVKGQIPFLLAQWFQRETDDLISRVSFKSTEADLVPFI